MGEERQPEAQNLPPLREIDHSSPFFLHPSENPALILVDPPLDGKNYHAWSRAMRMVLLSKNKLGFIDGSIPKPAADHRMAFRWSQCDTTVMSWILKTIVPSIARTVIWLNTSREIWKELELRYANMDAFRLSDLLEELNSITQGNQSVTDYFSRLKPIMDEILILKPIPSCQCEVKCTCAVIPTFVRYIESEYVIRFMKGLNENFASVRSQVYLTKPLLSLNDAFAMCVQHERQLDYSATHPQQLHSTVFANRTQNAPGTSRGYNVSGSNIQQNLSSQYNGGEGSQSKWGNNPKYNQM